MYRAVANSVASRTCEPKHKNYIKDYSEGAAIALATNALAAAAAGASVVTTSASSQLPGDGIDRCRSVFSDNDDVGGCVQLKQNAPRRNEITTD